MAGRYMDHKTDVAGDHQMTEKEKRDAGLPYDATSEGRLGEWVA